MRGGRKKAVKGFCSTLSPELFRGATKLEPMGACSILKMAESFCGLMNSAFMQGWRRARTRRVIMRKREIKIRLIAGSMEISKKAIDQKKTK